MKAPDLVHGAASESVAPGGRARQPGLVAVAVLSIASSMCGLGLLWDYAHTAGPPTLGDAWPTEAVIARDPARPTLVLFLHPQCTCSEATLYELNQALQATAHRPRAYALVLQSASEPDRWVHSALWQAATSIPDLQVLEDRGGREAARFGARVSGDVMLFAADGRLLFAGGITQSRGHIGANPGSEALRALLDNSPAAITHPPAFGCLIVDAARPAEE